MSTNAIKAVADAVAAIAKVEELLRNERLAKARFEAELEALRAERAEIQEQEDRDNATRLVDGEEAVPPKPARATRLAQLRKRIPATAAAIPLQDERIAACQSETGPLKESLNAAALDMLNTLKEPEIERIAKGLGALAKPMANLLAADIVQLAILGNRFPVKAGQVVPVNGSILVKKLIEAIPKQLRSSALEEDHIWAAARSIADGLLKEVNLSKGITK